MGRRSVPLHDERRWVFNRLAGAYRERPPYPAALVDRLAELARGGRVADLAAGTGDLALPLARRGLQVDAAEPARAMLDVLEERRGEARVVTVHAAAEATGLAPSTYGLVTLADAVHWVDPQRAGAELARLLEPEGVAAVVEARFAATPFMRGLAELLAGANPKARPRTADRTRQLLALATGGAPRCAEPFVQQAFLDPGALEAVVASFSYAGPALGPEGLARLQREVRELAGRAGGASFRRELTLRWSRRRAGRP